MSKDRFRSSKALLSGTTYTEVRRSAQADFRRITQNTRRQPYLRSAYFRRSKIFTAYFWSHLCQKSFKERVRRLKYFSAALDLIRNSRIVPDTRQNPNIPQELLHRFYGTTSDNKNFIVQIKENKKNDKKFFMSVFPE